MTIQKRWIDAATAGTINARRAAARVPQLTEEMLGWFQTNSFQGENQFTKAGLEEFLRAAREDGYCLVKLPSEADFKDAPFRFTNEEVFAWVSGFNTCLSKITDTEETP